MREGERGEGRLAEREREKREGGGKERGREGGTKLVNGFQNGKN